MKRLRARFAKAADMDATHLTKYAQNILATRADESKFCYATSCEGGEFEVRDGHVYFPCKLKDMTCECGKRQGCGILCKHALWVMFNERLEASDFVSLYFKDEAYKQTYGEHIHPMPDQAIG
ncbi:uncharacterized protein LOC125493633 [Beta vulgaris subsp. vulgaris]|uniref:uncharacterized protein LOC125493633 n=1 Tax=Beta vulgaris subsp. vulgaris TaxID=3555 RepID=UPI002036E8CD|nr:uncharacterized protein LOC125493633 [Beta vulgaris subsp. vulgaris]